MVRDMSKKALYKIIFYNQAKVYEIYAQSVHQGDMLSFIEVEKLVFGEKSSVVVDPVEENLKSEFEHVARTFIPLHSIIRIDEVNKQGTSKITEVTDKDSNVMHFPAYSQGSVEEPK